MSRRESQAVSNPTSPSQATSGQDGPGSTPQSSLTSPEPVKDEEKGRTSSVAPEKPEEEVEALSEMMCSLVTNQSGETRYFGKSGPPPRVTSSRPLTRWDRRILVGILHLLAQGHPVGE